MDREKQLDRLFKLAKKAFHDEDRSLYVVEVLSSYLRHRPNHGYAWVLYGESLGVIERYSEALVALKRALDLCPEDKLQYVLSRVAFLCAKSLSPTEAETWYSRAISAANTQPAGWILVLRGENLRVLERYEEARNSLERAIELDVDEKDEAYVNLALIARAQGKYVDARKYVRKALQLDPESEAANKTLRSLNSIDGVVELIDGL